MPVGTVPIGSLSVLADGSVAIMPTSTFASAVELLQNAEQEINLAATNAIMQQASLNSISQNALPWDLGMLPIQNEMNPLMTPTTPGMPFVFPLSQTFGMPSLPEYDLAGFDAMTQMENVMPILTLAPVFHGRTQSSSASSNWTDESDHNSSESSFLSPEPSPFLSIKGEELDLHRFSSPPTNFMDTLLTPIPSSSSSSSTLTFFDEFLSQQEETAPFQSTSLSRSRSNSISSSVSTSSQSSTSTTLSQISKKQTNGKYICGFCGKDFETASKAKNHKKSHRRKRKVPCTFDGEGGKCGKMFCTNQELIRHMASHTKHKAHACPNGCGMRFARQDAARRHSVKVCGLRTFKTE
ncbi:hypothetical protein HDU97_002443 [Phlyctochytrium planicorne]|nr:hypothetical protein HDU97_002443 [Phlyctochytrium planicorne]